MALEVRPGATDVAYFSMEIGLDPGLPTYSGGLGLLAGDMLRSAADGGLPMRAVSLVYRTGYFRQRLDPAGAQSEESDGWDPAQRGLEPVPSGATVQVEGRTVRLRAWRYPVVGVTGHVVPVYLLDTDLPENGAYDRRLTDALYGGDERYRLAQEIVLGIGGARLLAELGYAERTRCYHLNEGHSALLVLALLEARLEARGAQEAEDADLAAVRELCVFTTHTPVPAGHDSFDFETTRALLGEHRIDLLRRFDAMPDDRLNMTALALHGSRFVNGVALRHGEVLREMLPGYRVRAITNGVHAATWVSAPFRAMFERHLPGWERDNLRLRDALALPLDELAQAHASAKRALLREVGRKTGRQLDPDVFTLGFARRATGYKRADLIFSDLERLRAVARANGGLQLLFGGKAHPRDEHGKALIRAIVAAAGELGDDVRVLYLENYDMALAKLLCSGVDLWLNNPAPPQEASGTSGMKAALNAVPSLSVLDGWWVEGHIEGVTGWAIGGADPHKNGDPHAHANSLYDQLEHVIAPLYAGDRSGYLTVMRSALAFNGSFFNTQRMVAQYAHDAYRLAWAGSSALVTG
jgi:glycogen phosphorylase